MNGSIEAVWFAAFGERLGEKRKAGRAQVRVICPFHFDNHPSCDVHLDKNVFYCRSCGAQGGYLDVVIRAGFAHDRRSAAHWLEQHGVRL